MKSLVLATVQSEQLRRTSHRPLVRLLSTAPAALLLSGLFAVWAGPLVAPAMAAGAKTGLVAEWGHQWGQSSLGGPTVPVGLSGVTAIAAGADHSLALKSNGTVVAWGYDGSGQIDVPAGLSGVTAISAGGNDSFALKSNGTVVAWGFSGNGETAVPAGLSDVIAISAGGAHCLALKSNGTVVAWGDDGTHQTDVPSTLSGVIAIAAGGSHSLALKSNGTVVAWGDDYDHQIDLPAGLSGFIAISGGTFHSLALKSDGTVVAWGDDSYHQTDVPATLSGVISISAGAEHSLALRSNGTVDAWGRDEYGETEMPPGLAGVTAIAAGSGFSLALEPGFATHLAVSVAVNPFTAGSTHSVTVTALRANGNVAVGYRGTIHFTSYDTKATLPADYTFTASDSGVHTFPNIVGQGLTLKTSNNQWVRATDLTISSVTGYEMVTVIAGATKSLFVSGILNPFPAGSTHSFTVRALDAYGNVTGGYTGTVHFTSSDAAATLPADYTFTASDAGGHTFPNTLSPGLTLRTAGSKSVTATDTATSSITGSETVTVTPGAAKTLSVSGIYNPFPSGSTHSFTVKALDAYGNVATGYTGTIHITSSDQAATLPADYTFTAADKGVHTFPNTLVPGLTLRTPGSQWVRATDTATASITGSETVTVTS